MKQTNRNLVLAFLLVLPGAAGAGDRHLPTPITVDSTTSHSLRQRSSAALELNIYVDYSHVSTSRAGSDFHRDWKRGEWAANIKLHRSNYAQEVIDSLASAPVVSLLKTAKDKSRFLGKVQVVVTTNRFASDVYLIGECEFIRQGSDQVHAVPAALSKFYRVFELEREDGC